MKAISQQLTNLFIGYYDKMFGNKPLEARDDLTYVKVGVLKKITSNAIDPFRLTFLEQNPHKPSEYGKRASNGASIMWVIGYNRKTNKEKWIGRVENRVWYQK